MCYQLEMKQLSRLSLSEKMAKLPCLSVKQWINLKKIHKKNDHYHHQNDGQGNGHKEYHEKKSNYTGANHNNSKSHSFNNPKRSNNENKKKDFDSLMAGFLKESEDRLTSLKRNTEGKRGGRGGRRN